MAGAQSLLLPCKGLRTTLDTAAIVYLLLARCLLSRVQNPIIFTVVSTTALAVIFGYCIYILEREMEPELFDFRGSTYLAAQAL